MKTRQPACVILGPTGSGKTPLGDMLGQRGLRGRQCLHFDFGANLRQVVDRNTPNEIVSTRDIDFLRHVLETGALLEDREFPIAQRLLASFLQRRQATPEMLVVMNGLPRHAGQAEALTDVLDVQGIVVLDCQPQIVQERIAGNAGGDRTCRTDDDLTAIERKLKLFAERTAPLVDHYRQQNVPIQRVSVTANMTAGQMWESLELA